MKIYKRAVLRTDRQTDELPNVNNTSIGWVKILGLSCLEEHASQEQIILGYNMNYFNINKPFQEPHVNVVLQVCRNLQLY